jgi:hypothetical protein
LYCHALHRPTPLVFDSKFVEFVIVLNWAKFAVLFLDEKEGGGEGRFGGANETLGSHIGEEGVKGGLFSKVQRVDFTVIGGLDVWFEIDGMIKDRVRREGMRRCRI